MINRFHAPFIFPKHLVLIGKIQSITRQFLEARKELSLLWKRTQRLLMCPPGMWMIQASYDREKLPQLRPVIDWICDFPLDQHSAFTVAMQHRAMPSVYDRNSFLCLSAPTLPHVLLPFGYQSSQAILVKKALARRFRNHYTSIVRTFPQRAPRRLLTVPTGTMDNSFAIFFWFERYIVINQCAVKVLWRRSPFKRPCRT